MTTTNEPYVQKAIQGALADFDQQAGPSNINDPLIALCCRLLELSHAAPDVLSEHEAEQLASDRARQLGHDAQSIRDTWRSALRRTSGQAAHIPDPTHANSAAGAPGSYRDLADFEQARGLPAGTLASAGWSDSELYEFDYIDRQGRPQIGLVEREPLQFRRIRRAARFATDAGPRWRLLDGEKPKYWHPHGTHTDSNKAWYKLGAALVLAAKVGYLVLANGEIAADVAQHWGVPATVETGGGEKLTPPQLIQLLRAVWTGPILVPADGDPKGLKAAPKKAEQYRHAGYGDVRALDLQLGHTEDLADFCRLHQADSVVRLPQCADLASPPAAPAAAATGQRTQSQAIIDQLAQLGYTFRLNRCGSLIEVGGEPITDLLAAQIRTQLRDLGWKRFGAVEDAYTAHAVAHSYHPVRDYLEALRWDGQEHIAALATHLHSDDPPVVYPDGTRCSLVGVYLCRWLIGAVAKALDHQQNVMLVLAGPQNIGKSHLVRWLCPPALRAQHYIESPINPGDKDHLVRLMTKWIWEVGELDATTRKADVSALKDFITRGEVTVRRSYGRYDTTGPSMASFVGTVNNESGFLADPTGNRRFLVVGLTAIDWAYQQLDIDQIWAEAVARLRAGESWQLLPEEANHQAAQNRQYQTDSVLIDHLRKHLFFTSDSTDAMTAGDVVDMLRLKDVKLSGSDRAQAMEISAAMAALGVQKDRRNNVRYYIGIQPK